MNFQQPKTKFNIHNMNLAFVGSFVGYNYLLNIIKVLKIYHTRKIIKNLLLCKLHMFYK